MKTLGEALDWYLSTRKNLLRMQRLGKKHWEGIASADSSLARDDDFRTLEARTIEVETAASLAPIDDLAVVVLFSVFEAVVRAHVVERIRPEADGLTEPILKYAAEEAVRGVEEGSFYRRVLEPLKEQGRVSADLVTQVNQVRDYRNWVAPGRRDRPRNSVEPKTAYDRLVQFLGILEIAVRPELIDPDRPGAEGEGTPPISESPPKESHI